MAGRHVEHDATRSAVGRAATVIVVVMGLSAAVGFAVLRPGPIEPVEALARGEVVKGTVNALSAGCGTLVEDPSLPAGPPCTTAQVTLEGEGHGGEVVEVQIPLESRIGEVVVGDQLFLERPASSDDVPWAIFDRERSPSLFWLALVFAIAVIALARLRGLGALVGLVLVLVLIQRFTIPAILDGSPPLGVALVTATLTAIGLLLLAQGPSYRTSIAIVGTMSGVVVASILGALWVPFAHLTGLAEDASLYLAAGGLDVDLSGLLLAGIVIGALGAIDDVAVTQVSAVWEIHGSDPERSRRDVFRAGMRVGREHLGSIVNTLLLAYAGASLPLLILFELSGAPLREILSSELVATELVRTFVGSLGLLAALPVTTWLASWAVVAPGNLDSLPA